jgi:hypothetical protein
MFKRTTMVAAILGLVTAGLVAAPASATPLAPNPDLDVQGQGLSIAEAGVGLDGLGSGSRNISITIGGPVQKAFLFWAGRQFAPCSPCPLTGRDQQLVFDGNPISGTLVGSEPEGQSWQIGYRADVTSIVTAKGSGTYTISDGNLANNLTHLNGAGLFVIYRDLADTNTYRVIVFEGLDFAFWNDPTQVGRTTVPVTFNHGAATTNRDAQVVVFVGDARDIRPDRITINGSTFNNQLDASDGIRWDTDSFAVTIPANVASTTVQLFSDPPNIPNPPISQRSDSLLWEVGALRIPIPVTKLAPQVTSEVHDANHNDITGQTVAEGTVVHDEATVSGTGPTPTGTVDFARFDNDDCTGTPVATENVALDVNGQAESSDFTTVAGSMAYKVHYNGDDEYAEGDGPCEPLTVVGKLAPDVTSEVHDANHDDITGQTVPVGTVVHDEATVSGTGPTPTGTVDFARFDNGSCSGTPVAVENDVDLDANGQAESSDFTTVAGNMAYQVHYDGDANYTPGDGPCEPLTVAAQTNFCPSDAKPRPKPQVLVMRYVGEDCTQSSHSQAAGKVTCTGDPNDDPSVFIVASGTGKKASLVYFSGTVPLNGTYEIDATNAPGKTKLETNTMIKIYDVQGGTLLQTVVFHTSCSQPLNAFDQFGANVLEGFTPEPP